MSNVRAAALFVFFAFSAPLLLEACEAVAPAALVRHDSRATEGAPDASDREGADEPIDSPPPPDWSEDGGGAPTPVPDPVADAGGGDAAPVLHDRFASAKTCSGCHQTIYKQWSTSM